MNDRERAVRKNVTGRRKDASPDSELTRATQVGISAQRNCLPLFVHPHCTQVNKKKEISKGYLTDIISAST